MLIGKELLNHLHIIYHISQVLVITKGIGWDLQTVENIHLLTVFLLITTHLNIYMPRILLIRFKDPTVKMARSMTPIQTAQIFHHMQRQYFTTPMIILLLWC